MICAGCKIFSYFYIFLYLSLSYFLTSGLKQIHALSIQGNYELRIDLEDFENSTAYAQYGTFGVGLFSVDPDDDGYPLTVGDFSGNAGMHAVCKKTLILPFLKLISIVACLTMLYATLKDGKIFPLCSRAIEVSLFPFRS